MLRTSLAGRAGADRSIAPQPWICSENWGPASKRSDSDRIQLADVVGRCQQRRTAMPGVRTTTRSVTGVLVGWFLVLGSMSARMPAQIASGSKAQPTAAALVNRELLDKYCITCHNEKLRSGGLDLVTLDVNTPGPHADTWEKVVRKLRMDAMPPVGRPRPDAASSERFIAALESGIDRAAAASPNPGRTEAVHRLNRAEYQNAVRDLLALEIDGASMLPADDADRHGFDNIGDVLSVSPALLERYMSAARTVGTRACGG